MTCGLMLAAGLAGCGGEGQTNDQMMDDKMMMEEDIDPSKISGKSYKYATNSVKLPSSSAPYSIDIDGDGRKDNQLRNITGAISAMFDLDRPIAEAVKKGEAVILAEVVTADLAGAGWAKAILNLAEKPATEPRFDGKDTFKIAGGQAPAIVYGKIEAGKFNSIEPSKQKSDRVQKIELRLPLAEGMLPLVIYGAHVQGIMDAKGIMSGELHGVIRKQDIDQRIIPSIAELLTKQINTKPNDSSTRTIITLFEDPVGNAASKAKCEANPKDCCQDPVNRATCKITAEEVRTNLLIGNVLAPDVKCFEGDTWKPVPKAKPEERDSMSVGLGFTSVPASF